MKPERLKQPEANVVERPFKVHSIAAERYRFKNISLVTLSRNAGAAASEQKIEIRAAVRLQDMVDVELLIAAASGGRGGGLRLNSPGSAAAGHLVVGYAQLYA